MQNEKRTNQRKHQQGHRAANRCPQRGPQRNSDCQPQGIALEHSEEFGTLVHELAHEMLHCHERRESATKRVPETEAEAVSFVVCNAIGLDTGTAAQDSIHLYQGYAKLLTESLDCIQQAANRILT